MTFTMKINFLFAKSIMKLLTAAPVQCHFVVKFSRIVSVIPISRRL